MRRSERAAMQRVIDHVADEDRRRDAGELLTLMAEITGQEPRVWSANTIGYGQYHYRYGSGQEGDFFVVGFSPRSDRITLYLMSGLRGFEDILNRLGPHRAGKSTVQIKRLDGIDRTVLAELIAACVAHVEATERLMGAIPRMSEIPARKPPDAVDQSDPDSS